jgi:hypothetical protein
MWGATLLRSAVGAVKVDMADPENSLTEFYSETHPAFVNVCFGF